MPIVITPEVGIPLPIDVTPEELTNFREKAHAWFTTVQNLVTRGADVALTPEDKTRAHTAFAAEKLPAPSRITPGTIINLEAILNEWDQEIIGVSTRLRHYVTNKLIAESVDPDPRQRMKALENLGRIADVGLFSDRVNINVAHRTVADIEIDLAKTLEMYAPTVLEHEPLPTARIDVDAVLGEWTTPKPSESPTRTRTEPGGPEPE